MSSSTISYILTHPYSRKFRKISTSQNLPANQLSLTGLRSLNREGQGKNLNPKSEDRLSHSGRKTIRTDEVIEAVRQFVLNSPKRSTRKRLPQDFSGLLVGTWIKLQRIPSHGHHLEHIL